jgi:isopentenyl diphosphate isomerase/L-lactate dehydrogenase-like FMN-dependent dehydrogenase
MNDNTILRIKVPAHLYESVKEQLTLTEAKKGSHNYGSGMEVVKEKKMKTPKDGMKKVEEMKDNKKKVHSLDELKKAKAALDKKIHEMENTSKEDMKEYVGMSPDQVELVNTLGQLIAGGAASATVIAAAKNLLSMIKGSKKPMDNKEIGK